MSQSLPTNWTIEQVLALAADANAAKQGQALATGRKWQGLGANQEAVWGECRGSDRNFYQTEIDLRETAFKCSCVSGKFICQHGLALLLLFVNQPDVFGQNQAPDWVQDWISSRRKKQAKRAEGVEVVNLVAQGRRAAKRWEKVAAGIGELDIWLRDLVRQGLAILPEQDEGFWERIAARMVDAQARLLARQLRQMSCIPYSGSGWEERLLVRLGRLHLLIEGFKRLESLPGAIQADILTRIDWEFDKQLVGEIKIRDCWLVLGQVVVDIDGEKDLVEQRTWLWGCESRRFALVINSSHISQSVDISLIPGNCVDGELGFYLSGYPLRARVKVRYSPPTLFGEMPGEERVNCVLGNYAKALACQPWIEFFPVCLRDVIPQRYGDGWGLRDGDNYVLPISPGFTEGWLLLAVSGGYPLSVFGEWDGNYFLPLSTLVADRLIRLRKGIC